MSLTNRIFFPVRKNEDGTWLEIVSGDLKSAVLVIRPLTDIYAVAKFSKEGETVVPTEPSKDQPTSPKTGYPIAMVIALMGLAIFGGAFAVKKIKG